MSGPRRWLVWLTLALLMLSALGCLRRPPPPPPPAPQPTMEGARAFADAFMTERWQGHVEEARARLSPAAMNIFATAAMHLDLARLGDVAGIYIASEGPLGTDHQFVVAYRVHQVSVEVPYAAHWMETLIVVGEGDDYIIDEASQDVAREAFVEGPDVYFRHGDEVNVLFGLADLPDASTPQGAPADFELGVGKEGYVLLAFDPSGEQLAFVTWGTHGFLGTIVIPDGVVEGLDVHFEGVAVDARWSPDGQLLAAVIDAPTGNLALVVYQLTPRDRVNLGLEGQFPPEEYSLAEAVWIAPRQLSFTVSGEQAGDPKAGRYVVDIDQREVRRAD